MTERPTRVRRTEQAKEPEPWWRSSLLWTAAGAVVGTLGLVVALIAWIFPSSPEQPRTAGGPAATSASIAAGPSATVASSRPAAQASSATVTGSSATAQPWATGPGVTVVTGSPTLLTEAERNDFEPYTWHLDTNRGWPIGLVDLSKPLGEAGGDLIFTETGIGMQRGAQLAPFSGGKRPTLQQCGALTPDAWQVSLDVEQLHRGKTFCLVSAGGRFGYLRIGSLRREQGVPVALTVSYALWRSPGG